MKTQFILFQRGQTYYCEDTNSGKQTSLRTKDKSEALTLLHSRNEASRQPMLNLPLAEQTRIVAEVERRLSVVEELESVVSANLQRATRLRQSILQKAFTGELVAR